MSTRPMSTREMISRSDRLRLSRGARAVPRPSAPGPHLARAAHTETSAQPVPPIRLASRQFHPEATVVRAGRVSFGAGLVVIAGPCSIESRRHILETARRVKTAGADMLRGGAYKPRTSPYDFQGLGEKALRWLAEAGEATGLPVVTEVLSQEDVERVAEHADLIQVGARNMQNTALLRKLARTKKPVLLKRGASATISEWLLAAEYLLAGGNPNVVLCERGIRTFETATRNTLDLAGVALVKQLSHLPVIVDPSHATGLSALVPAASRAAVAVGADGLLIEVHPRPSEAWSDGAQTLDPITFAALVQELRASAARTSGQA